ncbi:MAG: hypothetical protein ACOCOW_05720 [Prevotella sp.]
MALLSVPALVATSVMVVCDHFRGDNVYPTQGKYPLRHFSYARLPLCERDKL